MADIPYIIKAILNKLKHIGFDGATVHTFQGGLEEAIKDEAPEAVAILAMSHESPLPRGPLV